MWCGNRPQEKEKEKEGAAAEPEKGEETATVSAEQEAAATEDGGENDGSLPMIASVSGGVSDGDIVAAEDKVQGDSSQVSIVLAYLSSLYMKHSWNPSTRWEPTWVEFVWCILTLGKWKTTPQKHAIKFGGDFGKKWNSKIFLVIWFLRAKI